jgi:predicted ATPase
MLRGWVCAMQGEVEEGLAQLRQGLTAHQGVGTEATRPMFLSLLASACAARGEPEEGLQVIAEALMLVEKSGVRYYEAELYRLQGELLLCGTASAERQAADCLHQALDVARHRQAKSWELRTAVSLSRLLQRQGKQEEARQLLAGVYGWFTEGFDTADLQEARGLLAALGG